MSEKMPDLIEPLLFAERRRTLSGNLPLSKFRRLSDVLVDDTGSVAIDISFDKDGRQAVVRGSIKGTLQLACQSCLQSLPWPVSIRFKLGIVSSMEEAERLGEEYEPLLVGDDKLPLAELVEDEILLLLPDYPKHEHLCIDPKYTDDQPNDKPSQKTDNPFSILAKLKKTGEQNGSTEE